MRLFLLHNCLIPDSRLIFNHLIANDLSVRVEPVLEGIVNESLGQDSAGATNTTGTALATRIEEIEAELDIDGNGQTTVTDGRLIFNYLIFANDPFVPVEPVLEQIVNESLQQDSAGADNITGESLESQIVDMMGVPIDDPDNTESNYIDVAIAFWNSGHDIEARQLADLLWDEGATQQEMGQAMKYLGLSLETIADAVDDGVTQSDGTGLNYIDVAITLWNSGHDIEARQLDDLLWDEGATQQEMGQAMEYLGLSLETIADAVDDGVTQSDGTGLNYIDVAIALWNSGHEINATQLAGLKQ
ncbi:MAG: hypothetical protein GVY04_08470 [Cyanobacteria bacterium]|nr:hypothetical protein [Cyanobacteria bacterium GSL.Bin1]